MSRLRRDHDPRIPAEETAGGAMEPMPAVQEALEAGQTSHANKMVGRSAVPMALDVSGMEDEAKTKKPKQRRLTDESWDKLRRLADRWDTGLDGALNLLITLCGLRDELLLEALME
jgi:hypothetical protein